MHIRRLILQTSSVEATADFYGNKLGLVVSRNNQDCLISTADTELIFTKATTGESPYYHFAFNIPSNSIQAALTWLKQKSEPIWIDEYASHIADFTTWKAKAVYFFDVTGNIVELIAREAVPAKRDGLFSPADLLYVSEIGIVFTSDLFDLKVTELLTSYGLNYFERQTPQPQFKAIGDDEGLLIAVTDNRNWYPTQVKSGLFPMQVDIEHNGESFTLAYPE